VNTTAWKQNCEIFHLHMGALLLILWLATACGGGQPLPHDADSASSGALTVELLPTEQQHGGSLAVRVVDAAGQPITDATVRLEGDMNHAGMIPVITEPVGHEADGVYRVPFEFTMLGDWILSVFITTADGQEHELRMELGVREDGVIVQ
jgi:hypothetical protein